MAAAQMARVLRPGGRLGLTDPTVNGTLPEDLQSLLAWVACVAGAGTPEEHVATLRRTGFADFTVEDQRDALLEMVNDYAASCSARNRRSGWANWTCATLT